MIVGYSDKMPVKSDIADSVVRAATLRLESLFARFYLRPNNAWE